MTDWEVLFRTLAALAADLAPGRAIIIPQGGERLVLRCPGWSNGLPGWWFQDWSFMTFANMVALGVRVAEETP